MIFDSHAHYDDKRYNETLDALMEEMYNKGVRKILNVASTMDSLRDCYGLANKYDIVYSTAGIHPNCCSQLPQNYLGDIEHFALTKKCVAIGEIGLDYYYENTEKDLQKKIFREQLELAIKINLPVIIHCRDAYEDTLNILKEYKVRGVIHCYSGSVEMAREFLKLDMHISFTGVVTFKNSKKAIECLKEVPLNRLLIETDSPYMSPEPNRGKINNSSNIHYIAEKYAEVLGCSKDDILKQTYDNAVNFFNV